MPLDLDSLLAPESCALITQECQRGVIGEHSSLPALAEAAGAGMIQAVAELVRVGRAANVPIIHCTAERRRDGRGANSNARLFQYMGKVPNPLFTDSEATLIVPEIPVADSDFILPRLHGLSPFQGTELDSILRLRPGLSLARCPRTGLGPDEIEVVDSVSAPGLRRSEAELGLAG